MANLAAKQMGCGGPTHNHQTTPEIPPVLHVSLVEKQSTKKVRATFLNCPFSADDQVLSCMELWSNPSESSYVSVESYIQNCGLRYVVLVTSSYKKTELE